MADDIEARILRYVRETAQRNEFPSRSEAIRRVTGELSVMPSAVAKAIARMLEAGTLEQPTGDQLRLKG